MTARSAAAGVEINARPGGRQAEILSAEALGFLADLHRRFNRRRLELLARRMGRQEDFDAGELPDFLPETKSVRDGDWKVAPIPADLLDRRVEITGPVDRKMIVNALNSGAKVFMADFEDATSPMFANMVEGQANLKDRWAGKIDFTDPATGKSLRRQEPIPRCSWCVRAAGICRSGMSPSMARKCPARCSTSASTSSIAPRRRSPRARRPPFTCQSWKATSRRDFGTRSSRTPSASSASRTGSFKATVLIETLPAAFEMDEILYELRDHIVGLNCGRWDYIFSFIKRLGKNPAFLTPDRSAMTMGKAFLSAYSLLLIKTCHRRGAFAMGGMAAQIPVKGDTGQRGRLRQGARRQGARGDQRP